MACFDLCCFTLAPISHVNAFFILSELQELSPSRFRKALRCRHFNSVTIVYSKLK